ncbi:MAG: hypothetical protein QM759_06265 [Terricaulis sp.]
MSDDRLERAMSAATPPRDPAFILSVLRAAENARYKRDRVRRMLIGAGLAVDCGLLLLLASYLINANPSDMLMGVGAVALCGALLLMMRTSSRLVSRSS